MQVNQSTCSFFDKVDFALLKQFLTEYLESRELFALIRCSKFFYNFILQEQGVCDDKLFKISPLLSLKKEKIQTLYFHEQIQLAKKQFMVSCGENHTVLAVKNQIFTFGDGVEGQLGFGDLQNKNEAEEVPFPSHLEIKSVVGGGAHTIILTKCGKIFGFGDNRRGALGPTLPKEIIASPTDLNFLDVPVSMISCAKDYTAVVLNDLFGTVIIMSDIIENYFSLEQYEQSEFYKLNRGSIKPNSKITDVSAGYKHMLLLTDQGESFAVGSNNYGQLGIGEFSGVFPTPQKIIVNDFHSEVAQVAAGEAHSLILTKNGRLFSMGNGSKGQLGNGKFTNQNIPLQIKLPNNCFPVIITCGNHHSVILDIQANVLTCGANEFGQTATRSNFFVVNRPSIVQSGEFKKKQHLRRLFHVAAGKGHTAVLGKEADLFMFGQTEKCGGGGFIRQYSHKTTPIKVTLHGCVSTVTQKQQYFTSRYRSRRHN